MFHRSSNNPMFPVSRDYEMTIKCNNENCLMHGHDGNCTSPSLIEISKDGKCKVGQYFDKNKTSNDNKNAKFRKFLLAD